MDFYKSFKESEVYKKFYQGDDEFEVVDEFLKGALVQDPGARYGNYHKLLEKKAWEGEYKVDQKLMTSTISDIL